MSSIVDRWGIEVRVVPETRANILEAEKSRDIALVKMRSQGQTWRAIGVFLGLSHEGARKRWKSIPAKTREHYSRVQVA